MSKNEQFEVSIIESYRRGEVTRGEAALILGVSEKTVQRKTTSIRLHGLKGIKHGNHGRTPANKISESRKQEILDLVRSTYFDFNLLHAHEMLAEKHNIHISYGSFYAMCRKAGLGKSKRRRTSKARIYRERMSNEGLLLQMDGSHHKWNGKDEWCLIAMIDDATSDIPYGEFFPSETTWACLKVLRKVIERKGIPHAIYTDNAGWAGSKRENFTQFKRACQDLGINLITTSSPQAKGRIENAWKTTQGRLIPEMRLYGIKSMIDANRYMLQSFLPQYWNRRNTVAPKHDETRYRPVPAHMDLDHIFCLHKDRIVASDHTISYLAKRYKIKDTRFGNLKQKSVTVTQDQTGRVKIYYGHLELKVEEIKLPKRKWLRNA